MNRLSLLLKALITSVVLLSGCNDVLDLARPKLSQEEPPNTKITLKIMHFMAEDGARIWLHDVIQHFAEKNPEVQVEVFFVNSDNYHAQLRNKIASNDPPDLFLLRLHGPDRIYIEQDLVENFSKISVTGLISDIEGLEINGGIYTMPFDLNAYGVFYNKEVFRRVGITDPPVTYHALMEAAELIAQHGFVPFTAGYEEINILNSDLLADILVSQSGVDPNWRSQVESREIRFQSIESLRAALIRLFERFKYAQEDPFNTSRMQSAELVATGQAAMLVNGTWFIDSILSHDPVVDLGFFPYPYSDQPEDNVAPLGATGGWAIFKHSPVKQYAIEFLESMMSEEMAISLQRNKKAISIIQTSTVPEHGVFQDIQQYIRLDQTYNFTGTATHFSEPYHQAFHHTILSHLMEQNFDADVLLEQLDQAFDRLAP